MDAAYEGEVGVRKGLEGDLGATRKALADVTNEARQLRIDVRVLGTWRRFDQTSTLNWLFEDGLKSRKSRVLRAVVALGPFQRFRTGTSCNKLVRQQASRLQEAGCLGKQRHPYQLAHSD
jgi:hypothetical protein